MGFDLNTRGTGIAAAKIIDGEIKTAKVADAKTKDFDPSTLGFMKSKKTLPTSKNGSKTLNTYYKPGESFVSETNKKKRDKIVRNARNQYYLDKMGKQMVAVLRSVSPDLVLIERNEMFRGVMTIEVLAKLTGILIGECVSLGIPYELHNVNTVRKPYNVPKIVSDFSKTISPEELNGLQDVSKSAIKWYLEEKYSYIGLKILTTDGSDAFILVDYRLNHYRKDD